MAAYDVRVQFGTDERTWFSLGSMQRDIARFVQETPGVVTVWIDGQKFDPEYDSLDPETDA